MITRYNFMEPIKNKETGRVYSDIFSMPLKDFRVTEPVEQVMVKEEHFYRPDLFFNARMGTNNQEDIVLWLNNISCRREMTPGLLVEFPVQKDMNNFYVKERK